MNRIRLALGVVLAIASITAAAQSWPAKPIRWIVPTVGGSAVDVNARRVAPKLGEYLGQPIIVENRAGGNSAIGAREVARAPADGYTVFQAVINNALNDLLAPDNARLNRELMPVTSLFSSPLVMVAHPSMPGSLGEFLAAAKVKPQGLTFASGGTGAITQLLGERLKTAAGIDVREIPYKSIGAEVPDLLAGHVNVGYLVPSAIAQHVLAGKLRGYAVASTKRVSILPAVPTMAEAGLPGVEAYGWNGIFVPAGTPEPVIRRLHQEIAKVLSDKDIREEAANLGSETGGLPPEAFGAFVRDEIAKWGKVIKDAGIKLQ